jgi:excisionase family DNA binding protein
MAAEPQAGSAAGERLAYRPAELAAMVGLSAKAIYRAIWRGELQAAKIANGSRLLIPAEAAEAWLLDNAVAPEETRKKTGALAGPTGRRPLREALTELEQRRSGD